VTDRSETSSKRRKDRRESWAALKSRSWRRKLAAYRLAMRDPRTPLIAKLLLGAAVGYALLPFDLIPDFIPVVGHLDDILIVPGLIALAVRMIPEDVLADCMRQVDERRTARDEARAR
jgi:uncharacterized membrane protein YkvA (DUF1232 family)